MLPRDALRHGRPPRNEKPGALMIPKLRTRSGHIHLWLQRIRVPCPPVLSCSSGDESCRRGLQPLLRAGHLM